MRSPQTRGRARTCTGESRRGWFVGDEGQVLGQVYLGQNLLVELCEVSAQPGRGRAPGPLPPCIPRWGTVRAAPPRSSPRRLPSSPARGPGPAAAGTYMVTLILRHTREHCRREPRRALHRGLADGGGGHSPGLSSRGHVLKHPLVSGGVQLNNQPPVPRDCSATRRPRMSAA